MRRLALVSLIVQFIASIGGCAAKGPTIKMASYERGSQAIVSRTPRNGVYQVKWLPVADGRAIVLPDTTVFLKKGSPLGFKTDADQTMVAIGGDYELKLAALPAQPGKLAWCSAPTSRRSVIAPSDGPKNLPPFYKDDLPGKREGLIQQFLTDPGAFWR